MNADLSAVPHGRGCTPKSEDRGRRQVACSFASSFHVLRNEILGGASPCCPSVARMSGKKPASPVPNSGRLRVRLSHAIGLRSMDSNGYSDPFVKLTLGKETH